MENETNFETDLNDLSKLQFKKRKKSVDIKRSPMFMKLDILENKLNKIETELRLLVASIKNESLKNHYRNQKV